MGTAHDLRFNDQDIKMVSGNDWGGITTKEVRFTNNIFHVDGKVDYAFKDVPGAVFHNNVYFGNHQGRPNDAKAITTNPGLAKPGSGGDGIDSLDGYKLKDGAPCVGAGIPIAENGGRDSWGNPVAPGAKPDLGAHAYAGTE